MSAPPCPKKAALYVQRATWVMAYVRFHEAGKHKDAIINFLYAAQLLIDLLKSERINESNAIEQIRRLDKRCVTLYRTLADEAKAASLVYRESLEQRERRKKEAVIDPLHIPDWYANLWDYYSSPKPPKPKFLDY